MEILVIALLFGGGLLVAAVFMYLATRGADSIIRILIYATLAIGCLFGQRSCWQAASEIGRATGGGSSSNVTRIPEVAIAICILWTGILVFGYFVGRKNRGNLPPK